MKAFFYALNSLSLG